MLNKKLLFFMRFFCYCANCAVLLMLTIIAVARIIWEGIDLAVIVQHASIIVTVPWIPYWKEILFGAILFAVSVFISCRYWKWCTPILLGILCFTIWDDVSFSVFDSTSIYKSHYIIPKVIPERHKNVIVISLESIDSIMTWEDVTGGQNLIPNLTELRKNGTYFDGYNKLEQYTSPTIPSFIAMNCGIPRKASFGFHLLKEDKKRYQYNPNVNTTCVSDFLRDNGYQTYFITGAKLQDEGLDRFLKKHPFNISIGKSRLLELGYSQLNSKYRIPDSEVFRYVKDTLKVQGEAPFFFYIVTSDTHGPKEFIFEPACQIEFEDGRDSYKCLDKLVLDFVHWIQNQPWYANTVIYLVGDHLAWGLNSWNSGGLFVKNIKNHEHRQIYNLVLNGRNSETKVINKKFAQFDFAPTILESAGFRLWPRRLGLGVSLWSKDITLVEQFGSKTLIEYLKKSENYYDKFFD